MDVNETNDQGKFCQACGKRIPFAAHVCPYCNAYVGARPASSFVDEHRTWLIVLLLCVFVGPLGLHRFYVGKTGTGILMLLSAGGLGIWVIVDLILIVMGRFTDGDGKPIY